MSAASPYEVLELPPGAGDAEVKAAYRRLVALYHPDNNPGFPAEATQKLRELNDALAAIRGGWQPSPNPAGASGGGVTPPAPRHRNPPRRWDPPQPPPRAAGPRRPPGPTVPPRKYADVPPPRSGPPTPRTSAEQAALAQRRTALVADLVGAGFYASVADAAQHPGAVEAFLPAIGVARLRSCAGYDGLSVDGELPPAVHHHAFMHAVPSLEVGGPRARQEAVERIHRALLVAATDDALLWTTSTFAEGDGILLQEDIAVHRLPRDAITGIERRRGGLQLTASGGALLGLSLGREAAGRLAEALAPPPEGR